MGMAVAAAGNLLGGLAAQAIMGKPTTYGPDTSIPGVTSATIKKGGKGQPDEKVPQVDITQSLKWFQEAADLQTEYYNEGLNYYRDALKAAAYEVNQGYTNANNTLKPLSYSSTQALNEQMRMMGLDPLSATHDAYDKSGQVGASDAIRKQIADAEKIQDPSARAAAKANIMRGLNAEILGVQNKISSTNGLIRDLVKPTDLTPAAQPDGIFTGSGYSLLSPAEAAELTRVTGAQGYDMNKLGTTSNLTEFSQEQIDEYNSKRTGEYNSQLAEYKNQLAMLQASEAGLTDFLGQYDSTYTDNYDRGYTGAEVEARVASTPGYQFQLNQGTKAIERQGAAAGMLGSGNTLTALTNYGQGLAQNYYGVYMDNLARIVNEGSGATQQIAQNQVNQGKDYGALIEAGGAAMNQTAQLVGNAQAESKYRAGQLFADAAQFNASMQFSGIQSGLNRQHQTQLAAMNNQAPLQMANIAQQRFNYGVFQNQQGGAAYAANV